MNEKSQLHSLLIKDGRLEKVQAKLSKFNPMKILGVQDFEIRHSNVLGWLFDPKGNHTLDDIFIKKYLLHTLVSGDNSERLDDNIDIIDIYKKRLLDIEVYREKDNIDILLVSKVHKFVVLIENKVYSGEHSNQLDRYIDIVTAQYHNYKIIPIYLTLEGIEPSNKKYLISSYEEVITVLESVLELQRDVLTSEVIAFLDDYITVLKEKFGMDEELKNLCKEIYRENKDAIDLIHSVGTEIDISSAVSTFTKEYSEVNAYSYNNRSLWFNIPEIQNSKKMNTDWGNNQIASFWFVKEGNNLKIVLEIGPFDDGNERVLFINHISKKGYRFRQRAKSPEALYTRIYTKKMKVKDWTDKEEIFSVMASLYADDKKMNKAKNDLIDSINEFDWK